MDVTQDWFWEGNVADAVASFLLASDWSIRSKADTRSKERGVDVHASKGAVELYVEAKGWPSKTYRDPRRAGQTKPTNPTNQAAHWYAQAMLKALRLQTAHPAAVIAIALPDFPRYRRLFEETRGGLAKLAVVLLFVSENGRVDSIGL
ncbi:hypothetical protein [Sphingobium sp. KCTC 72723]|uniref:hypothetical protein n=1 Tax=Sphingobium sp. KCTC 72723 TaxID=2733867 RepID=UPI00165D4FC1|nr:hypothetical protein [Sphingobium sp. KCTC 72723]